VYRGEGVEEYRNPTEFFRRTFLTEGLRHLLTNAVQRLSGTGGDPVVDLQTNFGGGKTHSMLALYHLFSGVKPSDLSGIEPVLEAAGVTALPKAQSVVLVGTALSPAQTRRKPDGTIVRTLWGDLAWQLLGKDGFALVVEADRLGVSPGSDVLREIFAAAAPCLILIDEWVAYVRQLYVHPDDTDKSQKRTLPGGTFEANMTFAQSLTEAAKAAPKTLVVATLPASDIEVGGEGGREALAQLKNTFARVESPWRPAGAEESFEIVRRRLFQPLTDPQRFVERDAVVRKFAELYRSESEEFPLACREATYERRLRDAYPIHPELFDRLYTDWSSLEKFQRTRGVLRLMAAVIHSLWERQDASLLIMPASVPIDEPGVQRELTKYVDDPWVPVIEKDVDGPSSLPLQLDRENPNLGRYSACRRVARTLYLGSAPTLHSAHRGLEDRQAKLGCAQPGESVAIFGDALRRLTDQATHLYVDGRRYWYSTQPTVTRLAQERAIQQDPDVVTEEIKRCLREEQRQKADFAGVHVALPSSEIPDSREVRLVILGPEYPHASKVSDSLGRKEAETILGQHDSGPRNYPNTVVFLAADRTRLRELEQAVRSHLAWKSIVTERTTLNLDAFQAKQAQIKCEQAEQSVHHRIPETYHWLLVPTQSDPQGSVEWAEIRLQGQDALAIRAAKKLKNDGQFISQLGASALRLELDRIPLWRGDHINTKQLAEDFARYLYLPRVKDSQVLLTAIAEGVGFMTWQEDAFAYADGWDATRSRYQGLQAGQIVRPTFEWDSVIVKSEVAVAQLQAESVARGMSSPLPTGPADGADRIADSSASSLTGRTTTTTQSGEREQTKLRRFHGAVALDASRVSRDAGKIAEEVVQHLAGLLGAEVEITLEIHARVPDGVPDKIIRTVTENCRTLRFKTYGFEDS